MPCCLGISEFGISLVEVIGTRRHHSDSGQERIPSPQWGVSGRDAGTLACPLQDDVLMGTMRIASHPDGNYLRTAHRFNGGRAMKRRTLIGGLAGGLLIGLGG